MIGIRSGGRLYQLVAVGFGNRVHWSDVMCRQAVSFSTSACAVSFCHPSFERRVSTSLRYAHATEKDLAADGTHQHEICNAKAPRDIDNSPISLRAKGSNSHPSAPISKYGAKTWPEASHALRSVLVRHRRIHSPLGRRTSANNVPRFWLWVTLVTGVCHGITPRHVLPDHVSAYLTYPKYTPICWVCKVEDAQDVIA